MEPTEVDREGWSDALGPYEIHVFVCTHGAWCPRDGDAEGVHKTLKKLAAEHGVSDRIRVNHSGCFSQCGHGPMVVVYPENVWYHHMTRDKAAEVFHEHFMGGRPVEAYVYRTTPGAHKVPRDPEGNLLESPDNLA